jgi:hypothetical protein
MSSHLGRAALVFGLFSLGVVATASANTGAPAPDKSKYHLFNPTPVEQMRDFVTDRPDRTESPITVDAGHFQLEADFVTMTQEAGTRSWSLGLMNLKAGLTNRTDLQVVVESYRTNNLGKGFGNTTLRYKVNLFGNDGGPVAMGVMPYVILPTQSKVFGNYRSEGGVIFPISLEAPEETGVGIMFQVDKLRNEEDAGFHTQFISSITASHDLFWGLEGYVEFFSQTEREKPWVATVDAGLVLPVGKSIRFDLGANVGVTDAADDINPFLGVSMRH